MKTKWKALATNEQIAKLEELGYITWPDMTKAEASRLLRQAEEEDIDYEEEKW